MESSHFAINVLAADQAAISRKFSGPDDDKFEDLDFDLGKSGAPIIPGAVAIIECAVEAKYPGGDHIVVLGRVQNFRESSGKALVFYRGRFVTIRDEADEMNEFPLSRSLAPAINANVSTDFFSSLYWAFNCMSARFGRHRDEMGLTLAQVRVLIQLYNNPGITKDKLKELTYLGERTVDETIDEFIKTGDVVSLELGEFSLTASGAQKRRTLEMRALEFEKQQTSQIPDTELRRTQAVLDSITNQTALEIKQKMDA
jgi:DNA-binding MarR family transcriptional regulator